MILKASSGDRRARFAYEAELSEALRSAGLPAARTVHAYNGSWSHLVEGKTWVRYAYIPGCYYTGGAAQLKSASIGFSRLSKAFADLRDQSCNEHGLELGFLDKLIEFCTDESDQNIDPSVENAAVFLDNRQYLKEAVYSVINGKEILRGNVKLMHTDYHPHNLLFSGEKLACILDFEDVKPHSMLAANGFAALKLIRQSLVDCPVADRRKQAREQLAMWIENWNSSFPAERVDAHMLRLGACYQVLSLIYEILSGWLLRGDLRQNFALPKHLVSLHEIEFIFANH